MKLLILSQDSFHKLICLFFSLKSISIQMTCYQVVQMVWFLKFVVRHCLALSSDFIYPLDTGSFYQLTIASSGTDRWKALGPPISLWSPLLLAVAPSAVTALSRNRFLRLGNYVAVRFSNWVRILYRAYLIQ